MLFRSKFQIVIICLLGVAAYSNTLQIEFVFDDFGRIVNNITIRELTFFLTPASFAKSRYVCDVSFALNYALHGLNPVGYHVFNLSIHLITSLLVYATVQCLFQTPRLASDSQSPRFASYLPFCVSLLFVAHPVQTQAITYIVQRYTSLATLFYVLSIALYLMFRINKETTMARQKQAICLFASLMAALLAVKTKEISFTLPLMMVLVEYLFFTGKVLPRMGRLLPYFVIASLIPFSYILPYAGSGNLVAVLDRAATETADISRYQYLLTQFNVIMTYIRLLLFPVGQHIDYEPVLLTSFAQPAVFLPFIALIALLAAGVGCYRVGIRRSNALLILAAFGIFWFFLSLSVESSIIPIRDTLFEHRMYLPSIGFFLSVSCLAATCVPVNIGKSIIPALLPLVVVLSMTLAAATYVRNSVWQDRISIWKENVEKEPRNERGHLNLAHSYNARGMLIEAQKEYEATIELNGMKRPKAMYRLGQLLIKQRNYDAALEMFLQYLVIMPKDVKANIWVGFLYRERGQLLVAEQYIDKALAEEPHNAEALYHRGVVRQQKGDLENAAADFAEALRYRPDHSDAANMMGMILLRQKKVPEAIKYFSMAIASVPYNIEAINNLVAAKKLLDRPARQTD
ncbi:MAG: tetratricopeptide repeat protein [Desulfuromonadaceae bacterium]|nr:tetratricopeptide repeat protein [Desulfuromonadaceae bacterium]MDD5104103.1 tetratricopeptide repeat protein [Desulfuromonadaceae bacterium]